MSDFVLLQGDCLEQLKGMPDNSLDSLVTDPPAGISFMGKDWDSDKGGSKEWIAWMESVMRECLRVLKPGAHALIWAIPRTSHWTATACEQSGFEIRDVVTHVFGSGFPKSLDISKAIDKAAGAEREVVSSRVKKAGDMRGGNFVKGKDYQAIELYDTAPATREAKEWVGYGTALKPASEHWILARKPLSEKTVAKNVLKWGVGGINIDASRIESADQSVLDAAVKRMTGNKVQAGGSTNNFVSGSKTIQPKSAQGRFPANLVLSHTEFCTDKQCDLECAVRALDEQSGILKQGVAGKKSRPFGDGSIYGTAKEFKPNGTETYSCEKPSGASRFFYCAKASKSDKGIGNTHPTVKNTKLMTYLITMITPQGGIVLDPFTGSGSTGVAALKAGFDFIGIEQQEEYVKIAEARLNNTKTNKEKAEAFINHPEEQTEESSCDEEVG